MLREAVLEGKVQNYSLSECPVSELGQAECESWSHLILADLVRIVSASAQEAA